MPAAVLNGQELHLAVVLRPSSTILGLPRACNAMARVKFGRTWPCRGGIGAMTQPIEL